MDASTSGEQRIARRIQHERRVELDRRAVAQAPAPFDRVYERAFHVAAHLQHARAVLNLQGDARAGAKTPHAFDERPAAREVNHDHFAAGMHPCAGRQDPACVVDTREGAAFAYGVVHWRVTGSNLTTRVRPVAPSTTTPYCTAPRPRT